MNKLAEIIPDYFDNLMSKEYLVQMVDEMCLCGVGATFIFMLRKEYWLRHGMTVGDAESLSLGELKSEYGVSRGKAEAVKRWSDQLSGCMMVIANMLRTPPCDARTSPCESVHAQAPSGTISPKSKICGNIPLLMSPQDNNNSSSKAVVEKDAVEQILGDRTHHQMWLENVCCSLYWGSLLEENLEWVLVYFRGHLYREGKEDTLHQMSQFKGHFYNFCRNPTSANDMLRALHYHLDSKDREMGVITQDATFRTMMQNDFPNLYQMTIPLTMAQCNALIQTHGPKRVKQAMLAANMSKRALYTADAYQLVNEKLKSHA